MLVPKLLLTPIKIRIFGPKTAKFGPKSAFLVILGQILAFLVHMMPSPTQMKSLGVFPERMYQKCLLLSVKITIWAQKRPVLLINSHFWPNISLDGLFDAMIGKLMCWYCLSNKLSQYFMEEPLFAPAPVPHPVKPSETPAANRVDQGYDNVKCIVGQCYKASL